MGSPSWEHLLTGFFKIPLRFCGAVHPFPISTLNRIRDPLTLFPQLLFGIFLGLFGIFRDVLGFFSISSPLSCNPPAPSLLVLLVNRIAIVGKSPSTSISIEFHFLHPFFLCVCFMILFCYHHPYGRGHKNEGREERVKVNNHH